MALQEKSRIVVSAATGAPIDGDNDGQAGGDYVFTIEHRERHDSDNDINLLDLANLAMKWLWSKSESLEAIS